MALRLCLFGASDDTGNLGVATLLRGVLAGIVGHDPEAEVTVFDHGPGAGAATAWVGDRPVRYRRVGAPWTKRVHRPESFARLAVAARLGRTDHPGAQALRAADAVLVIAGGDSFADLYGRGRLRSVTAPMQLARRLRRPLVLLPQTYGPFRSPRAAVRAGELVLAADQAWARDRGGHRALRALTGLRYDAARHRLGIDVAFGVPTPSADRVAERYGPDSLASTDGELVTVNVSGLLANGGYGPDGGRPADYRAVMAGLVRHVLQRDRTARVVIVPHVLGSAPESDEPAARTMAAELGPRVVAAPAEPDPGLVKGLIAQSSWFCGARMHATIAALSAGVPAAAVGYSDKFAGTFAEVDRATHVADARRLGPAELLSTLVDSYERRHDDRPPLVAAASHARVRAQVQFDDILAVARPAERREPQERAWAVA
jgi:polysaccharide pyruvyl transferase WcaK-like protein